MQFAILFADYPPSNFGIPRERNLSHFLHSTVKSTWQKSKKIWRRSSKEKARKICRQQQRRWPNKSVSLQKCQENLAPGYHFRPLLLLRLLSLVFTQKKSSESWIILLPKVRSSVQILAAIFQVSALPKDDGVQKFEHLPNNDHQESSVERRLWKRTDVRADIDFT